MEYTKLPLNGDINTNLIELKNIINSKGLKCLIKEGKILFNEIDSINLTKDSEDEPKNSTTKNTTILIFKNYKDSKLLDTHLLLYPQYIFFEEDIKINNQKLKNILQNVDIYTTLMAEESNYNNNKRMGQQYFDIVKSNFNNDSKLDDIKNYCSKKTKAGSCKGTGKYYSLFTRAFNTHADLFYTYALKRSSEEKHHREISNWNNKIIRYDIPHLQELKLKDKEEWYMLNLKIKLKEKMSSYDFDFQKKCDLNIFDFKNRQEVEDKIKYIVDIVKNTNEIRYITLSLGFLEHSNRITIDIKNKRITRIEPHGFGKYNFLLETSQFDCLIRDLLKNLNDFDYINQQITNNDIPKEILSLFGSFNIQKGLPLCQIYSAYLQLLSIHYPKFTIITLNEIVSKHNIDTRISNFFKLFYEYLNVNLEFKDIIQNYKEQQKINGTDPYKKDIELDNIKNIVGSNKKKINENKPIYKWYYGKYPDELTIYASKSTWRERDKECDMLEDRVNKLYRDLMIKESSGRETHNNRPNSHTKQKEEKLRTDLEVLMNKVSIAKGKSKEKIREKIKVIKNKINRLEKPTIVVQKDNKESIKKFNEDRIKSYKCTLDNYGIIKNVDKNFIRNKLIEYHKLVSKSSTNNTLSNGFGASNVETNPFIVASSVETNPFIVASNVETNPFGVESNVETNPFIAVSSVETNPFGVESNVETNPFGVASNVETFSFGGGIKSHKTKKNKSHKRKVYYGKKNKYSKFRNKNSKIKMSR